jgi:hypothetical protein
MRHFPIQMRRRNISARLKRDMFLSLMVGKSRIRQVRMYRNQQRICLSILTNLKQARTDKNFYYRKLFPVQKFQQKLGSMEKNSS